MDLQVPPPLDVNPEAFLADRAVLHATHVARLGAGVSRRAIGLLEREFIPELEELVDTRLSRIALSLADGFSGPVSRPWRTQQYRDLITKLKDVVRRARRALELEVYKDFVILAQDEAKWQHALLLLAFVGEDFRTPSRVAVADIVKTQPAIGHTLSEWFTSLELGLVREIDRRIRVGMSSGDSVPKIMARVRALTRKTLKDDVNKLVTTGVSHVSNGAKDQVFKANQKTIGYWQFHATLDSNTCPICAGLDGRVFRNDRKGPFPPRHIWCRCFPSAVRDRKNVGDRISFDAWLKTQSAATQNEVLGVEKARVWRTGKVPLSKFATNNRVLTLEELRQLEPDVFK